MINIKSIWENQKPEKEKHIVRTRIAEITHFECFVATNHIIGQHIYIMSVAENITIPELKNFRFKGVEVFAIDINSKKELYINLLDNELKDIFSLFIQNILSEIQKCITENEAITKTLNIVSKWKKLFDKINIAGLNQEEQKGLIGELLFLNYLIDNEKTKEKALAYWTSPEEDFEAKDFILNTVGCEIKFTTAKHPKIKISSERQLEINNLDNLFLILYTAEPVKENGFSLNTLVEQIKGKIKSYEILAFFDLKLGLKGYFEQDKEFYTQLYSLKNTFVFCINNSFPKIIKNQLPLGIYDVSYSIEISATENFITKIEHIFKHL
ncbi:MAG: PD-(D/E)XK motif protein [Capnocytophaga sp.]|nr:PD-(D/E)XK motif protein [Capnocytophaga sp.]